LALPVDTPEEFAAAYQRLKDHGVAVTEIIERGYGKTSLCCTDQHPGAVRPPQRHLREANVLRPPKLEHPV
jgi:Glyoxalase/Bleomycin resistance protein/Dioxygenase superfamily